MKKFRQAFGPERIFPPEQMFHQHRLLFFAVAFVFAVAVGVGQLEIHARAGTSPAATNTTAGVTYPTEASSTNSTGSGRAYSIEASSIEARNLPNANKKSEGESRFAKLDIGGGQKPVRVHYVNYGKASGKHSEALVLIHGWTMNVDNWRDQIPDFARRSRVIAVDLPGHGQSDKPQTTYSMDLFARAVDAVMRDAKVKRAVLVGHSMGTPVVRQFYRKYPEETLAIVIVDGALRPFGDKAMMDRMVAGFRGPDYQKTATQMFAAMSGPNLTANAQERIKASFLNTPQYVVVGAMEGMADASIWGEDKINVPVLAIMAKNPFYPPNLEERYRAIAPNMEFHMWEGVGHFVMMEKPKEFNDAVLGFLDQNNLLKR